MLFDAHCHAHFAEFKNMQIPQGAQFVPSAIDYLDWLVLKNFACKKKAYSLCPMRANQTADIEKLPEFLKEAAAVGETGLDFRPQYMQFAQMQIEVFKKHISLAKDFALPVVIHCVNAYKTLAEILKNSGVVAVFHSPNFVPESDVLKNAYFSFSAKSLDFKKAQKTAQTASIDRLLIESDGFCSQQNLESAAKKLMAIRNEKNIGKILNENFLRVYGK